MLHAAELHVTTLAEIEHATEDKVTSLQRTKLHAMTLHGGRKENDNGEGETEYNTTTVSSKGEEENTEVKSREEVTGLGLEIKWVASSCT